MVGGGGGGGVGRVCVEGGGAKFLLQLRCLTTLTIYCAGLGGSVECAVLLEPLPRSAIFFRGD